MELIVIIITSMFICLCMLLSPSSASAMHIQEQPPRLHEQVQVEMHLSLPQLPRKLRFLEEKEAIISGGAQGSRSNKEKKDASPIGGEGDERVAMHGSKGTWEEWVEGSNKSHFFTMDYSHVKRRRPIHNKSLPVGP